MVCQNKLARVTVKSQAYQINSPKPGYKIAQKHAYQIDNRK